MTPEQFAIKQREFLIRTEKESAVLIAAEFAALKREIALSLTNQNTPDTFFIESILALLSQKIDALAIPFQRIVTRAQGGAVQFAARGLAEYLSIETSIFEPDREAIMKLIGRTQNTNTPLGQFFLRMKPDLRERARLALLESFALGESHRKTAKRLRDVTDAGLTRALTISRTETNESYRAASRDFYEKADIREYIWLSVLDPRTCVICWSLHGRRFKSHKKVFSHINCRCTLVPVTKGMKPIATGAKRFANLESGYQRQILGAGKYELFKSGDFGLNGFVGSSNSKESGERFFVRTLGDLAPQD